MVSACGLLWVSISTLFRNSTAHSFVISRNNARGLLRAVNYRDLAECVSCKTSEAAVTIEGHRRLARSVFLRLPSHSCTWPPPQRIAPQRGLVRTQGFHRPSGGGRCDQPSLVAPISTNAMTQGVALRLRHACRVPFCTTQSPCFRRTVAPSSSSNVISPEMTTP